MHRKNIKNKINNLQNTKNRFNKKTICQYKQNQVHFLCTIDGPLSSYSSFLIHISSNVDNDDNIEPPIQTEYFLSGGAIILIVMESGANALTSFCTLSGIFLYIVVPPLITILPYKSFRISTSHFIIDENVNLWMPSCSKPIKLGWNNTSGALKRSAPTVITWPSGSS